MTLAGWRLDGWRLDGEPWRSRVGRLLDGSPSLRATVGEIGPGLEEKERSPWARRAWPPSPDDHEVAQLWEHAFAGTFWPQRARWERLFLPVASRAFRAVLVALRVPQDAHRRALVELREAWFYALAAGEAPLLAARVAESAPGGPFEPLRAVFSDLAPLARCAAARGAFAQTVAALWPERPEPSARARALERALATPGGLDAFADAHVIHRLTLAEGEAWEVVVHNRRRLRARVRALAATCHPPGLASLVLGLPGLRGRTDAAVAAAAWGLAWHEVPRDFAFHLPEGAPCLLPTAPDPLPPDAGQALRTWVLLCLLRGRADHLRRWVYTAGTGDRDSTWGRLLADVPARLREADGGYGRLRAELADELDPLLAALDPTLRALAALPPGRHLPTRAAGLLREAWHPSVPFPRGGFPAMVESARILA